MKVYFEWKTLYAWNRKNAAYNMMDQVGEVQKPCGNFTIFENSKKHVEIFEVMLQWPTFGAGGESLSFLLSIISEPP
jgi:hypothetical protein